MLQLKVIMVNYPMDVTVSEDRIEKIEIDSSGESSGIADVVFTRIPAEIIEGQTLNVDAVSGASVTSNGVLDGVARAVKQAGANPDVYVNVQKLHLLWIKRIKLIRQMLSSSEVEELV